MMQNIVCCSCWFFLISVPGSCLLVAQVPGSAAALLVAAFTSYICLQTEARNSLRLLNQAPTYHFRGVTIRRSSADLRFISSRVVTFRKIWILQTETWGKIKLFSMQFYIYFKSIWEEQIFTFFRTPTSILVDSKT